MQINFMEEALNEAYIANRLNEVPVGAVVVKENKIVGRGHNLRETLKDASAHAEMIAIRDACKFLNTWRLSDCDIYVTLEPCPMCAGAIIQSRIRKIFIGTPDHEVGACGSVVNLVQDDHLSKFSDVVWQYDERCSKLLQDFFYTKRKLL